MPPETKAGEDEETTTINEDVSSATHRMSRTTSERSWVSADDKKKVEKFEKLGARGLHTALTEWQINNIKQYFNKAETKCLNQEELRKVIKDCAKLDFDEGQFELLFLRINIKRDGWVTWDEFISHLILGFKIQEVVAEVKALEDPISKKPRIVKSNHRHPINCLTFNFQVKSDRSYSYNDGSYLTASKDGCLNYWSLDLQVERTVYSKCTKLSVSDTWVLCVACLPDVSVICTANTERDLRFYDTSARKFELRVHVTMLDYPVCSMDYYFSKDINEDCKLIMGDMGGNVLVLMFSPINRGPFRSKLGIPLLTLRYVEVLKGVEPGFHLFELKRLHKEWVRQVLWYTTLNLIVSCSSSTRALVMRDLNENRGIYCYNIPKGAWCFAVADGFPLLATGGPDCLVRVWNPYVTKRPLVVFMGHHTGIIAMIMQDKGDILCSMSEDKCIKIWDVVSQECQQTYLGLGSEIGNFTGLTMFYNPESRQLIIGGLMIASLPLRPLQNGEHTDGNTHSAAISVLLYNPLFNIILTCGLDSFIIVWDPWSGKRISVVREAHTRILHGEIIPVDITAGTFDPGYQLLLTGAFDGSLKTWDFNTGTCLRNMRIEVGCEVTGVCWVKGRIMAIGWNKHVTEFDDTGGAAGPGGAFSKSWATRHSFDVLCAAARIPQTLATATYNGELVLWMLETGQPYKQYNVANPTQRIKISYDFEKRTRHTVRVEPTTLKKKYGLRKDLKAPKPTPPPVKAVEKTPSPTAIPSKIPGGSRSNSSASKYKRSSAKSSSRRLSDRRKSLTVKTNQYDQALDKVLKATKKYRSMFMPQNVSHIRGLAVRCILFLCSRPMQIGVASLVVALENGDIQLWSHHQSGGFIAAFSAIHNIGDYVVSIATDEHNEFIFLGTTEGYIKTFLMRDYYNAKPEKVCMPKYRLMFPFLWKRTFPGRALRGTRGQDKPILLNSFKGHTSIISGLIFIDKAEIIVSASVDKSARLWTVGGRYIGTLGTFKPWIPLTQDVPLPKDFPHTIPPDVKRVVSSVTIRVLMGETFERKLTKKQEAAQAEKELFYKDGSMGLYGKKLEDPILGKYIHLPAKTTQKHEVTLDTTFTYIPVYQHILRPPPKILPELSPPMSTFTSNKYKTGGNIKKPGSGMEFV